VDRAMNLAVIPVVERARRVGGVVLAGGQRGDESQRDENACYRRAVRSLLAVVMLLAASLHAHAEPADLVARPLVLAHGEVEAALVVDINVQGGQLARSTSLAPDLWIGATPELTVGLVHSNPSLDRFETGATFCVVHADTIGCDDTYRGSGIDVRYSALRGDFAVAPRARVLIRDVDPVK